MTGRRRLRAASAAVLTAARRPPCRRRPAPQRDVDLSTSFVASDYEVARQLHAGVTPLELRERARTLRLKGFREEKRCNADGPYLLWYRIWRGVAAVVCASSERSALAYCTPSARFAACSPDLVDPDHRLWFLAGPFLMVSDELLEQCDASSMLASAGSLEVRTAPLGGGGTPKSA